MVPTQRRAELLTTRGRLQPCFLSLHSAHPGDLGTSVSNRKTSFQVLCFQTLKFKSHGHLAMLTSGLRTGREVLEVSDRKSWNISLKEQPDWTWHGEE